MRQYKKTLRDEPLAFQCQSRIKQLYGDFGPKVLICYNNVRSHEIIDRHLDNLVIYYGKDLVEESMVMIFDLGNY